MSAGLLRRPEVVLAWIALATAVAVQTGNLGSIDTRRRLQVAHSFWTDAPQVRPADAVENGIPGRDGRMKAPFGLGQALLMLPANVIATGLLGRARLDTPDGDRLRCAIVAFLTFTPLTALTIVLAYRLLRSLGFETNAAVAGALGLQLGTSFLHYTQVHQENSLCLALALGAALGVLRWARSGDRPALAVACAALGFDLLVRVTTIVDAALLLGLGAAVVLQEVPDRGEARRRLLAGAAVAAPILAAFAAIDRAYHYARFGSLFTTYSHLMGEHLRSKDPTLPPGFPFGGAFWQGLVGPFVSPAKSVFVFDPLVLIPLALALSGRLARRDVATWWLAAGVLLLIGQVATYATYVPWGGSACWGDRYVLGGVHAIALLGIPLAWRAWPGLGPLGRRACVATIALSVLVQISSLLVSYNVESAQRARFVVPQRVVNVVALATGHFDEWGLSQPGFLETEEARRFTLLPFVAAQRVPRAASAAWAAWSVVLGILVAGLARCWSLARRGAWREEERSS